MPAPISSKVRTTDRLLLRPFRRRDADALLDAVAPSLPELSKWLPWAASRHYTRADALRFLRDSGSAWNEGKAFDFAIRDRLDPDRHLGNISLWYTSRLGPVGEIGYWIRTDASSRGICTEAAWQMLQIAFEELRMHRVVVRIAVGNRASERVAQKLGFVLEGTLREEVKVGSQWLDHTIWGLLEHEYRLKRAERAALG